VIEHRLHESVDEYVAETIREGLAHLRRWVFACEQTESRLAVQALRRAYDRNSSNLTVQAALGVALARGLDVQPPRAEGHNYRPATILSNAEREARRLLVRVLQAWPEPAIANELASMALATRDETSLDAAFNALEKLPNTPPTRSRARTRHGQWPVPPGQSTRIARSAACSGASRAR
jgi:invasion protein IalB